MMNKLLEPAVALASKNKVTYPNESAEYRKARNALLAEEIELRRHIERVAEQRRALPPGGQVTKTYRFEGEGGAATLADLFGDKQTLVVYTYMYGPQRERPCPMCTSLLSAWDGEVPDIEQRVALAVTARSPLERLVAFKKERGWRNLRLYSDVSGEFSRDYHAIAPDGSDVPGLNVFTRKDGEIRHFWSGEMSGDMSDPGPAWRTRPDADLEYPGFNPGRARDGLVSEIAIRSPKGLKSAHPLGFSDDFIDRNRVGRSIVGC